MGKIAFLRPVLRKSREFSRCFRTDKNSLRQPPYRKNYQQNHTPESVAEFLRGGAILRSNGSVVEKCDAEGNAVLSLRNKFAAGDTVEVVGPDLRPFSWQVPPMEDLDGVPLLEPRTPQMRFRAKLHKRVPPLSFIRHAVELSGR